MTGLVLYGRAGCHLCDDARAALAAAGIAFREVDIESDDGLHRRYFERIPVLARGDEVVLEGMITPRTLAQALG